jgi:hypothetical protein
MRSGTLSGVAVTRTIFMIEPPRPRAPLCVVAADCPISTSKLKAGRYPLSMYSVQLRRASLYCRVGRVEFQRRPTRIGGKYSVVIAPMARQIDRPKDHS